MTRYYAFSTIEFLIIFLPITLYKSSIYSYTPFLGIFGNLFPLINLKLKLFMVQIIRNSTVDPDGTAIGLIV